MYDLIIIGGGPAGLTAAVYAMNKRLEALLITEDLGGKANYRMRIHGLEGYETINGEETVRKFMAQVEYVDFARTMDKAVSVACVPGPDGCERFEVVTKGGHTFSARCVIVATGARPQALGVPGEAELLGMGVSYSAVSHAPLFWGRETAVVGNNDLAIRAAAELADIAGKVYLVAPNDLDNESAFAKTVASLPNVTVLQGHELVSVSGDPYLTEMVVRSADGATNAVPVSGLFVEIGLQPNTEAVAEIVELNDLGQIRVDAVGATSRAGVFAAGDVTNVYSEQVLIAIGDGAKAALAAYEYLLNNPRDPSEPVPKAPPPRPEQDW